MLGNGTNDNGVTFVEFTSKDTNQDVLTLIIENIYEFIPYDIMDAMSDRLLYDVMADSLNEDFGAESYAEYIGLGSEFYLEQLRLSQEMYVDSGALRQLLQIGLYNRTDEPVNEDYVDQVYQEFGFDEGFVAGFNFTYNKVYELMKTTAINDVLPTADFVVDITDYMRYDKRGPIIDGS